jgi:hypothetical protein
VNGQADAQGNVHGPDGRFVSPHEIERSWDDHDRDHERERTTAKETAQRLEREVAQTASRLERADEETAARIEKAVQVALRAVADTAAVHRDSHKDQHIAHERIHTVEKEQVEKAEEQQAKRDVVIAESLKEYKSANNEWGRTVRTLTAEFPQRLEMNALFDSVAKDYKAMEKEIQILRETTIERASHGGDISTLRSEMNDMRTWRNKADGARAVLAVFGGVVGAAITAIVVKVVT